MKFGGNISTIYIYNKTSIKRNIHTIRQNISGMGKQVGLRTYQHPCTYKLLLATGSLIEFEFNLRNCFHISPSNPTLLELPCDLLNFIHSTLEFSN